MPHLFYLHGFASSPASTKVQFLAARLAEQGHVLHCPDLNEPDFTTLTITRMMDQVEHAVRALSPGGVVLVGSSLGAFVALHLAERLAGDPTHPVERLILLAPALEFGTPRTRMGEVGLDAWREKGWLETMHYASGEVRRVHYGLYEDASRYDAFGVSTPVPTLVLQGRHDDVVDPESVARFASSRPHVTLVMLDDGHQLGDSLERVWAETQQVLGLTP